MRTPGATRLDAHGPPRTGPLTPTVVRCDGLDHPLARTEFPFPFVSVTAVSAEDLPTWLGPTLSLATLGVTSELLETLRASDTVERLSPDASHSLDTPMGHLHLARMTELLR